MMGRDRQNGRESPDDFDPRFAFGVHGAMPCSSSSACPSLSSSLVSTLGRFGWDFVRGGSPDSLNLPGTPDDFLSRIYNDQDHVAMMDSSGTDVAMGSLEVLNLGETCMANTDVRVEQGHDGQDSPWLTFGHELPAFSLNTGLGTSPVAGMFMSEGDWQGLNTPSTDSEFPQSMLRRASKLPGFELRGQNPATSVMTTTSCRAIGAATPDEVFTSTWRGPSPTNVTSTSHLDVYEHAAAFYDDGYLAMSPALLPSQSDTTEVEYSSTDEYHDFERTSVDDQDVPTKLSQRPCRRRKMLEGAHEPRPVHNKSGIHCGSVIAQNEFPCRFPGCKSRFKRQEHKKRHEKNVHEKDRHETFPCWVGVCQRSFSRRDNLTNHLKKTHGGRSSKRRNAYVATLDPHSRYYDPLWQGELTTKHHRLGEGLPLGHPKFPDIQP